MSSDPVAVPPAAELTAAQREVIAELGATPRERPEFSDDLRAQLRDELVEGVAPFAESYSSEKPLFLNKHNLTMVHGCEARFVHDATTDEFDWSVPIAVGSVTHKAIELSVHWRGDNTPLALVDEAMARLAGDDYSLGDFVRHLDESDRAQLRSDANDRVASFLECWPPLKKAWRPVTESRVRAEFLGNRIVASGRVDLTLGWPQGQRAGKVIIDLKTGRNRASHRDDLRFYALLETLKVGTPPRMGATYYLDQGTFVREEITEDVLDAAIGRFVAGVELMVELLVDDREPARRPNPGCNWCPLRDDCEPGRAYLLMDDGEGP